MLALGIDTSNYATSLAVVDTAAQEVVCAKKRLLPVPKGKLGLRQSDAVFHHTAVLPQLMKELGDKAPLHEVMVVGVSQKPRPAEGSYMPCFLAGVSFATAFSAAKGIAPVYTTHQQGHVAAALFATGNPELERSECLVFHVSGGTTELLLTKGHTIIQVLGRSLDLYAGQAVDRLGVSLGYNFPAGEQISSLAAQWDEPIKVKANVKDGSCHLSGLQNQCEQLLQKGYSPAYVAKYCLLTIARTMQGMLRHAHNQYPYLPVVCAGGVLSSEIIRQELEQQVKGIFFVPPAFAGDNAVGTALIGAKETNYWPI